MASHSWETAGGGRKRHAWEEDAPPNPDESDSDFETPAESPADAFIAMMIQLLMARTLNAAQFCVLMHHVAAASVSEARMYALGPDRPSGHYQRHLDNVVGCGREGEWYEADLPGHRKEDLSRTLRVVQCFAPHEWLTSLMEQPSYRTRLREYLSADVPRAVREHPMMRATGGLMACLALYIDGVPYSITDSVVGFWVSCLATGQRCLFGVLRKRHVCKCGCRGWCTFHAFFRMIAWSLRAIAQGVWPDRRHDSKPWLASDAARAAKAGHAMPFKGALIYIKGDWSEYASTLGFPTWQDGIRPCFKCNAFGPDQFCPFGHTAQSLRWPANDSDAYERACQRCEQHVVLDAAAQARVLANLRFDKRAAGSRGRALLNDMPDLQLCAGDRLEPSEELPDVGQLDTAPVPIRVCFWRPSEETLTRHRNPVFGRDLHTDPSKTLTVDELHALNLGVMQVWAKTAVWYVFTKGVYGIHATAEETFQISVLAMRHELLQWYKDVKGVHPGLTRLSDLTVKMFGTSAEPKLKMKGAETWGFLLFLVYLLEKHLATLGAEGARYLRAGKALVGIVTAFEGVGGLSVPLGVQQDCPRACVRAWGEGVPAGSLRYSATVRLYAYSCRVGDSRSA